VIRLATFVFVAAVALLTAPRADAAGIEPPYTPAVRLAQDPAIGDAVTITNGTPGVCDSWHDLAIDAGWTEQQWPRLEYIMRRESRCFPDVVNRVGCVGLLQICRGNFNRMGVNRSMLQDAATNLAVGHRLFQEWVDVGRSGWRPWYTRHWRPQ
jgi:hypothetical protein